VLTRAEHTGAGGVADSQRDAASVRISQAPVLEGAATTLRQPLAAARWLDEPPVPCPNRHAAMPDRASKMRHQTLQPASGDPDRNTVTRVRQACSSRLRDAARPVRQPQVPWRASCASRGVVRRIPRWALSPTRDRSGVAARRFGLGHHDHAVDVGLDGGGVLHGRHDYAPNAGRSCSSYRRALRPQKTFGSPLIHRQ